MKNLFFCKAALSNLPADQHLCFRYIDRTIPLLSKSEISSLLPFSGRNPEDRFCCDAAHIC